MSLIENAERSAHDEALARKEREELEFWRDSPHERPGSGSLPNLLNKFGDARRFGATLERYAARFQRARDVLELGGGARLGGDTRQAPLRIVPRLHV